MPALETMVEQEMAYPAEFVERVKEEFPHWRDLHDALELGLRTEVGNRLRARCGQVSPQLVVDLLFDGDVGLLRREAERLIARNKLYNDWELITR